MNEYYFRSLPYLGLFLFLLTAVNFTFAKYGLGSILNEKKQDKEILLSSVYSSLFFLFLNFLIILSIIFSVLDFYFGIPRGFMIFPLFQGLTLLSIPTFLISSIFFDREILENRHSFSIENSFRYLVVKNLIYLISITILFFNIYLVMVTEYSA